MLITAGADGETVRKALEKAKKKVYFLLRFFSLAAYAAPLRGFLYCCIRAKVFWSSKNLFLKKRFLAGCGVEPRQSPGGASHILIGVRGSAPAEPRK